MHHTIIRFNNGGTGSWAEFECGVCQIDIDLFDFDLQEWVNAAEDGLEMACPSCDAPMLVNDLTADDDGD